MKTHDIQLLNSSSLTPPAGHYSHVAVHRGLAYVSGQLPVDRQGLPLVELPFADQIRQVLHNVDQCLATAGTERARLIVVTIYLVDVADWPAFDEVYTEWIGSHRPARAVAGIASLHYGSAVEVQAVAAVPEPADED